MKHVQFLPKRIALVFIITAILLLIPFTAMQFNNKVNWSLFDFIIAGILLSGTGVTYELISRRSKSTIYKAAVGLAVGTLLLLIWVNLTVGIIGSEDNPANLLYFAVIATAFLGSIVSLLKPKGMAYTMFTSAVVMMLAPTISLIIWRPEIGFAEVPGIIGVFVLNVFFAMLFTGSGLLFKKVNENENSSKRANPHVVK